MSAPRIVPAAQWRALAAEHRERVDELLGPYLAARRRGATQPVTDFLFTYYPYRPALLRRWHPGFGVVLGDPDAGLHEYEDQRGYHRVAGGMTASTDYLHKRVSTITYAAGLLSATASRPPRLGCFGLHEWAMVYRGRSSEPGKPSVTDADARRHAVPLRLGAAGTDAVVESMSLQCTHFDAYRFFTEPAVGRNATPLTRETQVTHEQPGCLHASMDLYRLAAKLMPLLPSNLLWSTFRLAYAAREVDMRASPYDLSGYGYAPIRIETAAGRAEYVRAQSDVASRGAALRDELLGHIERLREAGHTVKLPTGSQPGGAGNSTNTRE